MIKSIEVEGYRLLDGFKADLGQVTVVIGANATGKSSLIDCLQLISWSVDFALRDALAGQHGLTSILSAFRKTDKLNWKLTFQKPSKNQLFMFAPLKDDVVYVYEVNIGKIQYDKPVPLYEVVRTEKPYGKHTEPFKLLEATRYRSQIYSYENHALIPFDEAVEPTLFPSPEEDSRMPKIENTFPESPEVLEQERTLRLTRMRFFKEYPILSWIRFLISTFRFYPGFDIGHKSKLRTQPAEIQPLATLSSSGDNLGTVLHEMLTRANYISAADELRDFLRIAYPSFENIFAETTFSTPAQVLVSIQEKNMKVRQLQVGEFSDGMLRFLCLGAALLNPAPPPFIAIDEPEVGLHPKLLPIVADMIKLASEKTQVLITTHSPDLLNCFDLDDVAVMQREGHLINWKRPGTRASLRKMLKNVVTDSLGDLHRSGELEFL